MSARPELAVEWEGKILIASLAGEVDLAYAEPLQQSILQAAVGQPAGVVLDVGDVTYLDSAGVRLLFLTHREFKRRRIPLVAVLPRVPAVRRTLEIAEVPTEIPVQDTRSEAIAHIKLDKATTAAAQLQHALDSRVLIEQAKGILAERHGVGVEQAFERMRTFARRTRRTVREIADGVVSGSLDVPA
ncbi:MAG: ANTAR domain-containing protein [Egibacteraceae bacterium]